jgi:SAM-dependent methyltransferase
MNLHGSSGDGSMSEQQIPYAEVQFHPHSFGDYHVRLFQWQGHLYRGICPEGAPFFAKLFQDGVIQKLSGKGLLIESELTSLALDDYTMVVRHRKLPFVSYPNEWCGAMFKDAALTLVDLAIELAQQGLTLGDAHPWNLLFDIDECHPVFVDLGSVAAINDATWRVYDEFCRFCLYPLQLMSYGQPRIARLLMCEDEGVLRSDLSRWIPEGSQAGKTPKVSVLSRIESSLRQKLPDSSLQHLKKGLAKIGLLGQQSLPGSPSHRDVLGNIREKSHLTFLQNVRSEVESIAFSSEHSQKQFGKRQRHYTRPLNPPRLGDFENQNPPILGVWGANPGMNETSQTASEHLQQISEPLQPSWILKQQTIHQILSELQPETVLDIGSGGGQYSKLAAALGSKVIALDIDETCISHLYVEARVKSLPILPLVMDFTKPTPARGLANHWAIAATERLQCEMVLALAVVDHIVFKQRLNFDQIVEGLAQFSTRWAVVEFIPREDPTISKLWTERVSWYTLDHFIAALRKRFVKVTAMPSDPEPRVLLLCEKGV